MIIPNTNTTRIYLRLMAGSAIIFLVLIGILAYNNRFAADDFFCLDCYLNRGIWDCTLELYNTWTGRWAACLYTGAVIQLSSIPYFLGLFNVFTFASLTVALALNFRLWIPRLAHGKSSRLLSVLYALLFVMLCFFTSWSKGESWFWFVSVTTYLWSIIAALFLIYVVVHRSEKAYIYLVLIVAAAFCGGASESHALASIAISVGALMLTRIHVPLGIAAMKPWQRRKLFIALLVMISSCALMLAAPGNLLRYASLPDGNLLTLIQAHTKAFLLLTALKPLGHIPHYLLFGMPWFVLGMMGKEDGLHAGPFLGIWILRTTLLLLIIALLLLPVSLVMMQTGPDRSMLLFTFMINIFMAAFLYDLGRRFTIRPKVTRNILLGGGVLTLALMVGVTYRQAQLVFHYADAVDSRLEIVKEYVECDGTLVLEPLPPSGMLYSAEISQDARHFTNRYYAKWYALDCAVKLP